MQNFYTFVVLYAYCYCQISRLFGLFQLFFPYRIQVKALYLGTGPGSFSQEFQAGRKGRIVDETIDPDMLTQFFPTIGFYQLGKDRFKGKPVQWIVFL